MTLKLLTIGRTGQVATEISRRAGPDLAVEAVGRDRLDLENLEAAAALITATDADVIVNAAAYTAVDKAEEEEALAHRVNGEAPGVMAKAAAARGLPFLHISTDYVFDGGGTRPWREDDPTGPLGAYGRTKLAGEAAVAAVGGRHAILRTAWVFAGHGGNFVSTMLRVGADRDRLTVVDDQWGGPTAAGDIADALIAMAKAYAAGNGVDGVFHYAGAPATTWRGFATAIFEATGWAKFPEVAPIATADWPTPATRPANSRLDCAKIGAAYGIAAPDWRQALPGVIHEIQGKTA